MPAGFESAQSDSSPAPGLGRGTAILLGAVAIGSFHLAYAIPALSFLVAVYLFCLFRLSHLGGKRQAFYGGLLIGLGVFVPQMGFLWTIFGWLAAILWLVLAFWHGVFLLLARECQRHLGRIGAALAIPVLWTGLEYFRSELYFLRFTWFTPGMAFSTLPGAVGYAEMGVYGVGFTLMLAMIVLSLLPRLSRTLLSLFLLFGFVQTVPEAQFKIIRGGETQARVVQVAGMQMEFPPAHEVPAALDRLLRAHPEAELLVLSEYTFDIPVPERVKAWCKTNKRYLIVGAQDSPAKQDFHNTAFVIGPDGEIVFQQGKSVPIQFMNDGLPAAAQNVWDSPWGKLAIPTCYDLSYTRPMDRFIRAGAQAIINPTMDVAEWGAHQHALHSRVPPVRAAEYRIPIFRVASSGHSQLVNARGRVTASAPFPGQGAMIAGTMEIRGPGTLPLDRWLAPACSVGTGLLIVWFSLNAVRARLGRADRKSSIATP